MGGLTAYVSQSTVRRAALKKVAPGRAGTLQPVAITERRLLRPVKHSDRFLCFFFCSEKRDQGGGIASTGQSIKLCFHH